MAFAAAKHDGRSVAAMTFAIGCAGAAGAEAVCAEATPVAAIADRRIAAPSPTRSILTVLFTKIVPLLRIEALRR
jgi:hypothetical protein